MNRLEKASFRLPWEAIDPFYCKDCILRARDEDLKGHGLVNPRQAAGDVTTEAIRPLLGKGVFSLVAREPMVLCGILMIPMILEVYGGGAVFRPRAKDGDMLQRGDSLGEVEGDLPLILQAERVLLNFLQYLCGISTHTKSYVDSLGGSKTRLLDTRKTMPGFRALNKYAVSCGGAYNHRYGLWDRVMLKDNHLFAAKAYSGEPLCTLVQRVAQAAPGQLIEVEVDALEQIEPAIEGGADILLLDNFSNHKLRQAVKQVSGRVLTEASGGVCREDLYELGRLGLDFISCGALVHQARWVDIGLDARM